MRLGQSKMLQWLAPVSFHRCFQVVPLTRDATRESTENVRFGIDVPYALVPMGYTLIKAL